MLYTSGTTGHPKGVLHRHREMAEHSMICTYFLKYNRDSIGLVVAPLYHCGELNAGIIPRIQVGGKNVILHHFDTETVLHTIQEEKITTFLQRRRCGICCCKRFNEVRFNFDEDWYIWRGCDGSSVSEGM